MRGTKGGGVNRKKRLFRIKGEGGNGTGANQVWVGGLKGGRPLGGFWGEKPQEYLRGGGGGKESVPYRKLLHRSPTTSES